MLSIHKNTMGGIKPHQYIPLLLFMMLMSGVGLKYTISSFAATAPPNGTVQFITYVNAVGDGNEIGNVVIATDQGGSGKQCSPTTGTTDANSGGNKGKVQLSCPAATDGGPRTYKFVNASRGGYSIRGDSPHPAGDTFTVRANQTTIFSILMKDDTPPPAPARSAPTVASTPAPASAPNGTLDIITYNGSIAPGFEIGNVVVAVDHGGSNVQCSPNVGSTDATSGANYGHVHLTCPAAANGGPRTYKFASASRPGYSMSSNNPTPLGTTFTISGGKTTTLNVLIKDDTLPPAATGTVAPSNKNTAPSDSPAAPQATQPVAAEDRPKTTAPPARPINSSTAAVGRPPAEKSGSVQVTTYVYDSDGTRSRVSGVNLHIQSVDNETNNAADSCADYNKTTNAKQGDSYGQVHFTDCWTGKGGTKAYQLSYTELPEGLTFRSLGITGPSGAMFKSGKISTTSGIGEQFNVLKDKETRLEIYLNRSAVNSDNIVRQIITQSGIKYVPAENTPAANQAAAALNLVNAAKNKVEAEEVEEADDDTTAPSTPKNLSAIQDNARAITLQWDGSEGRPAGEAIEYAVSRTLKGSSDSPDEVGDTGAGLSVIDPPEDVEDAAEYIYAVVATDAEGNESAPAIVEISTRPIIVNVDSNDNKPAPVVDSTKPVALQAVVASADDVAAVAIPVGASAEQLACTMADYDVKGDEVLKSIGTPVSNAYKPICTATTGEQDDEFEQNIDLYMEDEDDFEHDAEDTDLYGFDGTDWEEISTDEIDTQEADEETDSLSFQKPGKQNSLRYTSVKKVKNGDKITYTVKTKRLVGLVLVKRHTSQAPTRIALGTFVALGIAGVVVVYTIRRRAYDRYEAQYRDTDPTNPNFVAAPIVGTTSVAPTEHHNE